MKNTSNLARVKRTTPFGCSDTKDIQKSLKREIWTLSFFGKYDHLGTEYLIGKLNVYTRKAIYDTIDMIFSKVINLIRVDIQMSYKLDGEK